jgi:hypothetical protein
MIFGTLPPTASSPEGDRETCPTKRQPVALPNGPDAQAQRDAIYRRDREAYFATWKEYPSRRRVLRETTLLLVLDEADRLTTGSLEPVWVADGDSCSGGSHPRESCHWYGSIVQMVTNSAAEKVPNSGASYTLPGRPMPPSCPHRK